MAVSHIPDAGNPWAPSVSASAGYAAAGYAAAPGADPAYAAALVAGARPAPAPRSLRGLGTVTAVLLCCQAAVSVTAAGVAAWGVLSWSRISAAPADLRLPSDTAGLALLLLSSPLTLATAVAFIAWLYVAASNAHRGGAWLRRSPGWAVAGWFVPVLSLWCPKQVLDDVWRASMPGVVPGMDLRRVPKSMLVTGWWTAYLLAGVVSAAGTSRALYATLAPNLRALRAGAPMPVPVDAARFHETVALWSLWSAGFLVVAAGLAAAVVLRVTGWQQQRAAVDAA